MDTSARKEDKKRNNVKKKNPNKSINIFYFLCSCVWETASSFTNEVNLLQV